MIGPNGLFIGGFSSDILKEVIVADCEYLIGERSMGTSTECGMHEVWRFLFSVFCLLFSA